MTDLDFEKVLASVDLSKVMARTSRKLSLSPEAALEAEHLYRKFLRTHHEHPEDVLVPTELVDEVWHNHILFTRQYFEDCDRLFGRMLHHEPDEGIIRVGFAECSKADGCRGGKLASCSKSAGCRGSAIETTDLSW